MLHISLFHSLYCFCKRGVISPWLQKQYSFSLWQYSHQVNYYLSCWVYCSFFVFPYSPPSLLPAIGKKILNQKGFFFLFWGIFYLSHRHKESKGYSHRKGRLKNSRSSSLIYFLSLFYGDKTKPRGMAESQKGSQIGAGQGREGLDNAHVYACRVGGESTAVFLSPLMLPP